MGGMEWEGGCDMASENAARVVMWLHLMWSCGRLCGIVWGILVYGCGDAVSERVLTSVL